MESIDIIHELRKRGKSQSQLARDLGISISVVNNVIHGKVTSHTVAQHIAAFIGKEMKEIWPQQYIYKPRNTTRNTRKDNDLNSNEVSNDVTKKVV